MRIENANISIKHSIIGGYYTAYGQHMGGYPYVEIMQNNDIIWKGWLLEIPVEYKHLL